jgi:hypothetical protein
VKTLQLVVLLYDVLLLGILLGLFLAGAARRGRGVPVRCWFLGHPPTWQGGNDAGWWTECARCRLFLASGRDPQIADLRWHHTVWTT